MKLTTLDQIRYIIKSNLEDLGKKTSLDDILNGHYAFQTTNTRTITRQYQLVQAELKREQIVRDVQDKLNEERTRAYMLINAAVFLVIGVVIGYVFF